MITSFFRRFGLDQAIVYVLAGKLISILSGLSIILLIPHYLSDELQGYYYTFNSVVALQIIFELGLSTVIIQFASHEMAALKYDFNRRLLTGDERNKQRFLSLIRLSVKWYGAIAVLILLVVGPIGYVFFLSELNAGINWSSAWLTLTIATAINVSLISIVSIAEGCGLIVKVNKMRAIQAAIAAVLSIVFIVSDHGLYATAAIAISGSVVFLIFAIRYFSQSIRQAFHNQHKRKITLTQISWRKEIFPMQWRIALSWMSGYFIFFVMTPISFKYFGSVFAGKLGMSLTLCNMIMATGLAWISTKYPKWGRMISLGERQQLNASYRSSMLQSTGFVVLCMLTATCGLILLNYVGFSFASRFLAPQYFAILALSIIGTHLVACMATYIRAHKVEKMTWVSMMMAIITTVLMSCVAMLQYENLFIPTYCIIVWLYFFPHSLHIYFKFRKSYA